MKSATPRLRILVLGYLVRGPLGGIAWHYLQYVVGLSRLGHDVFFFEDSDDYPSAMTPYGISPMRIPHTALRLPLVSSSAWDWGSGGRTTMLTVAAGADRPLIPLWLCAKRRISCSTCRVSTRFGPG